MFYLKKVKAHTTLAQLNEKKAEDCKKKGRAQKSDHYFRIAQAHYRNASFYTRQRQVMPLIMAV